VRLKLDENLDTRLAPWLTSLGHDAQTVRDEHLSGAPDQQVFETAVREERCLVTLDLDFADPFRFRPDRSAGTMVLRCPVPSMALIRTLLEQAMAHTAIESPTRKIWIVEPGRVRIWESWDE
jgi:predicted nuclease of predicted toxin-antitoxin system